MIRILGKDACENCIQIRVKKNVEKSEIGPDSETLISSARKPVDLNFNRLSFIQDPVRDVRTKSPTKMGVLDTKPLFN